VSDDVSDAQIEAAARLNDRDVEARLAAIRRANALAASGERPALRLCCDCPDPIEPARLAVNPNAVRCTACQAAREAVGPTGARA
jgi:RNA polymerase-binding transcription factor DksA